MRLENSGLLLRRAEKVLPGGVNSPVRAFQAVGGKPPFMVRGRGSRLWDADGNQYLDFLGSWGPLILGHAYPPVVDAISGAAGLGTTFGAPTSAEVELAERVIQAFPSMEMVRFVSSGTEAAMSAVRLARTATGRSLIIKFDGHYHGHSDGLLVQAGSGATTFGVPDSAGVPADLARLTLSLPFNNFDEFDRAFDRHRAKVAAVIAEPVAGNMGVVPPAAGFLELLRERTARDGALLIFDEVITGFRAGPYGAQGLLGIRPDITCLGKIIGGGMPVGAYGARASLMRHVAPLGAMYQAGTLSGNPIAVAAGLATLDSLAYDPPYERLERLGRRLAEGLADALRAEGIAACINRVGSMLTVFFCSGPVTDYRSAKRADTGMFARFHHAMLERGIYWPPSQFEAAMISSAHSEQDIDQAIDAAKTAAQALVAGR